MDVIFGFKYNKEFYTIGDNIDVIFQDGTCFDGNLKDIRPDGKEIVVDSFIFDLEGIDKVVHLNKR